MSSLASCSGGVSGVKLDAGSPGSPCSYLEANSAKTLPKIIKDNGFGAYHPHTSSGKLSHFIAGGRDTLSPHVQEVKAVVLYRGTGRLTYLPDVRRVQWRTWVTRLRRTPSSF